MTSPFSKKPERPFSKFTDRLFGTPEQVLEEAYDAALRIKAVEDEYFGGGRISAQAANQGIHIPSFLWADLETDLGTLQQKMQELKSNGAALNTLDQDSLMKLVFAEGLLAKYTLDQNASSALVPQSPAPSDALSPPLPQRPHPSTIDLAKGGSALAKSRPSPRLPKKQSNKIKAKKVKGKKNYQLDDERGENQAGGVLPESIGAAINKIRNDLDPKAEEKAVNRLRRSRQRTKIGLRLLGLLIIVPILTQQVSKFFLVRPIVDDIRGRNETQVFLNKEWKEEALEELESFKLSLEFEEFISSAPPISEEEEEDLVKEKAAELAEEFREKSNNSVSNVFADLIALLSFALVLLIRRQDIAVLKSFIDSIVTGLSDSAKAFIIILVTDVSLGFHSPHGWDVLLESMANHLGVAANPSLISLFIATVPVIVDTMFKYWVFRSLSRMSPSTVATLKEMDD